MGKYYGSYLKMAGTPESIYKDLVQETINSQFDNTTQLRTIKEQS